MAPRLQPAPHDGTVCLRRSASAAPPASAAAAPADHAGSLSCARISESSPNANLHAALAGGSRCSSPSASESLATLAPLPPSRCDGAQASRARPCLAFREVEAGLKSSAARPQTLATSGWREAAAAAGGVCSTVTTPLAAPSAMSTSRREAVSSSDSGCPAPVVGSPPHRIYLAISGCANNVSRAAGEGSGQAGEPWQAPADGAGGVGGGMHS